MKLIDFLESRRKRYQDRSRFWVIVWYGCQFLFIGLTIANFWFLLSEWCNLDIILDDKSVAITFVSFLFAFAGINIYSIFNTNIEEEKKRLSDLSEIYEQEILKTTTRLYFTRTQIKHLQLCLFICQSEKYNGQIDNYLGEFNKLTMDLNESLMNMYSNLCKEKFPYELSFKRNIDIAELDDLSGDFRDNCRNAYYSFVSFQKRVDGKKDYYFRPLDEQMQNKVMKSLSETIDILDELQSKEYKTEDNNEYSNEDTSKSMSSIVKSIRTDFRLLFKAVFQKHPKSKNKQHLKNR